jgi:hypothetical protein
MVQPKTLQSLALLKPFAEWVWKPVDSEAVL